MTTATTLVTAIAAEATVVTDAPASAAEAVERLVAAYHSRGDADAVARAFHEQALIDRFGVYDNSGQLEETLEGREAIMTWLARTPDTVVFSRGGDVQPSADAGFSWWVRYHYAVPSIDFENGGEWRFDIDDSGLVTRLEHRPDDLPDQ